MDEPDPAIVLAAKDGDVIAFEVIVRAYQAPVWRYLRHLIGDATLAEDVTQETFIRVHRGMRTYDGRSRFSTWLFRVAHNAGVDAIRARDRRDRRDRFEPGIAASPERAHELNAAIAHLARDIREALLAVEILGLTYSEAGRLLGTPAGTVKSRVHRAREQLLRWLAEDGEATGDV